MKHAAGLIILLSFVTLSCKRRETCDLPDLHRPLTHWDTACIPYSGIDTFAFEVSDSTEHVSDTIFFVGSGKKYFPNSCGTSTPSGPCDQYTYGDAQEIGYFSDNSPDQFSIRLQSINGLHNSGVFINFNKKHFFYSSQGALVNAGSYYDDTAVFNGRMFYQLAYARHYDAYNNVSDKVYVLLNKDFGIVRFILPDGRFLTRVY